MWFSTGVAVVCAAIPIVAPATIIGGPITNPANGHDYYLLAPANWTDSEAEAVTLGGHLATINDAAENAWVFSTFENFGGSARNLFIGLNDAAQEGTFVWVSGAPVVYTNWKAGEPNDSSGTEDYGMIANRFEPGSPDGKWIDMFHAGGFFGPYPVNGVAEVVPEPTTAALLGLGLTGLAAAGRRRRA